MRIAISRPPEGEWKVTSLGDRRYRVFLDGAPVSQVFAADDEAGELWRHRTDGRGELVLTASREEIESERLTGVVRLERID